MKIWLFRLWKKKKLYRSCLTFIFVVYETFAKKSNNYCDPSSGPTRYRLAVMSLHNGFIGLG